MGDRVHASVEIGGHLETIEETEALIAAILAEGVSDQHGDTPINSIPAAQTLFREAVENGNWVLSLHDNEVNYGNFDEIEKIISENKALWCSTTHGAGAGYAEGINTVIDGEKISCVTNDGSPVVLLSELQMALKDNNPDTVLFEVARIVSRVERESGANLPSFTASAAVQAWLKIFGEPA